MTDLEREIREEVLTAGVDGHPMQSLWLNSNLKAQSQFLADLCVYSRNRAFRLLNSSKHGKNISLKLSEHSEFKIPAQYGDVSCMAREEHERALLRSSLVLDYNWRDTAGPILHWGRLTGLFSPRVSISIDESSKRVASFTTLAGLSQSLFLSSSSVFQFYTFVFLITDTADQTKKSTFRAAKDSTSNTRRQHGA